ncbi:hypothetical protein FRUB_00078 [Fimbriiglobus ruber]|uniref:DUF4276 family protein n=1 Tax=Fimbriiglobus ruber TaxID=1908690 RepID=A0A225EAG5_9BACT|nr:hypothetical protein FRUB_00078 [Fimbriiglobus ruber]
MNVFCEGQTEQAFCDQVLRPHLFPASDGIVHTLAVGEKDHHHVYGLGRKTKYERVRKFIHNTIKQRGGRNVYFTTLFDLYALPSDFPGKAVNVRDVVNPTPYVLALQQALEDDIGYHRFIAHLQLYEYETMLFTDPDAFAVAFEDCEVEIGQLKVIVSSEHSIEHINDGRETAPSKRIIGVFPEYAGWTTTAGPDIAEFIGVAKIRAACPHFDRWLVRLESIPWEMA